MTPDDGQVDENPPSEGHNCRQPDPVYPDDFTEVHERDRQNHVDQKPAAEYIAAEASLHPRANAAKNGVQPRQQRQRLVLSNGDGNAALEAPESDGEAREEAQDRPPNPMGSEPLAGRNGG